MLFDAEYWVQGFGTDYDTFRIGMEVEIIGPIHLWLGILLPLALFSPYIALHSSRTTLESSLPGYIC